VHALCGVRRRRTLCDGGLPRSLRSLGRRVPAPPPWSPFRRVRCWWSRSGRVCCCRISSHHAQPAIMGIKGAPVRPAGRAL